MTSSEPAAPACRHLLAVRGGTFACTLDHGHKPGRHSDEDLIEDGGAVGVVWECTCPTSPGVTVCGTFTGYDQ